jgi:peptidylprolyl isomerase
VTVPETKPTELVIEDIEPGEGPAAKNGDLLVMQYVGVSFSTRQEFGASWTSGQPLTLVLGEGNLIQGWQEGLVGMKLCGRRQLVIPPELGYGATGRDPIAPNETLVFVVDLVGITPN